MEMPQTAMPFYGYASLFGVEDLSADIVMPGAFENSLRQRGAKNIRLLYQHDVYEPIGLWKDIYEDEKGLRVEGVLLPQVKRGQEALALMQANALDGLSVGFRPVRATTSQYSGVRKLWEVDLWEISLVTFPMQEKARVTGFGQNAQNDRELVDALYQAAHSM